MKNLHKFSCFISLILIVSLLNSVSPNDERAERKKLFVLDNDACKLQRQDPWLLKNYYLSKPYVSCRQKKPFTTFKKIYNSVYVFLDPLRINLYRSRSVEIKCCLSNVTRVVSANIPDYKIRESKCTFFNESARVKSPIVKVRCFKTNGEKTVQAYENVYAFHLPETIRKTISPNITDPQTTFNVLMIGVSSVSRQNAIRMWPKTHGYLTETKWLNFEGYSQVGEKTISNLIPILSGCSEEQADKTFRSPWGEFYDNYDFVWNDYQNKGYITSFAEDHTRYAVFVRDGFIMPPTDFYFRPYTYSLKKLPTTYLDGMPHCISNENTAERILNLATDFVRTFENKPHFGLFLLNTFSARNLNAPSRMDSKIMEFFKGLEPHIHNTFIIFFSDHGYDRNNFTRFKLAWLESRQPFLYIHVPDRFKKHFSKEYEKIQENTQRLTSPYDLYLTLHDILKFSDADREIAYSSSCRKCNSLFRNIPEARTCADAGIEVEFCLCSEETVGSANITYLKSAENSGNVNRKLSIVGFITFAFVCDVIIERLL